MIIVYYQYDYPDNGGQGLKKFETREEAENWIAQTAFDNDVPIKMIPGLFKSFLCVEELHPKTIATATKVILEKKI